MFNSVMLFSFFAQKVCVEFIIVTIRIFSFVDSTSINHTLSDIKSLLPLVCAPYLLQGDKCDVC